MDNKFEYRGAPEMVAVATETLLVFIGIRRPCVSPGCPDLMRVDHDTRVWRCPMHGPMQFADDCLFYE